MARTGVFVCWCGSNIAKTVDVERVAAEAATMPGVAYASHYKYMCSEPGQAHGTPGHRRAPARPDRGRLLLPAPARADVPQVHRAGGPEPVHGRDGEHPRALLLGARATATRPPRRPSTSPGWRSPRSAANEPLFQTEIPHHQEGAGDRRRGRGDPGGAGHRGRRLPGHARRAHALHRRAHGPVRQDLPDARLRRVHPDAQDGRLRAPTRTSGS